MSPKTKNVNARSTKKKTRAAETAKPSPKSSSGESEEETRGKSKSRKEGASTRTKTKIVKIPMRVVRAGTTAGSAASGTKAMMAEALPSKREEHYVIVRTTASARSSPKPTKPTANEDSYKDLSDYLEDNYKVVVCLKKLDWNKLPFKLRGAPKKWVLTVNVNAHLVSIFESQKLRRNKPAVCLADLLMNMAKLEFEVNQVVPNCETVLDILSEYRQCLYKIRQKDFGDVGFDVSLLLAQGFSLALAEVKGDSVFGNGLLRLRRARSRDELLAKIATFLELTKGYLSHDDSGSTEVAAARGGSIDERREQSSSDDDPSDDEPSDDNSDIEVVDRSDEYHKSMQEIADKYTKKPFHDPQIIIQILVDFGKRHPDAKIDSKKSTQALVNMVKKEVVSGDEMVDYVVDPKGTETVRSMFDWIWTKTGITKQVLTRECRDRAEDQE